MSTIARVALLAGLALSACLQSCATTPAVMDKGDPIPIHSTDPRYSGYLNRIGQVDYVTVIAKTQWEVYDEYAVNAIRRAAPFPPVPPALMAQARPGSAGVRILAAFQYLLVDTKPK